MYAQFEDPDAPGMMESVTCSVRYYRGVKFADVANDVSVKTYYGANIFDEN